MPTLSISVPPGRDRQINGLPTVILTESSESVEELGMRLEAMPQKIGGRAFDAPEGVAVDAQGNLYTSSTRGAERGVVWRLVRGAQEWTAWGQRPPGSALLGLAVDEVRRRLYACASGCEGGSVLAYDLDASAPEPRVVASQLGKPVNAAAIHGDTLYVSFSGKIPGAMSGCIWRIPLDSDGKGKTPERFAELTFPNGLAISEDGRWLYVAQTTGRGWLPGQLTVFETATRRPRHWPLSGSPDGVALDRERGWLYVALHGRGGVLAVEESHLRFDDDPRLILPAPQCPSLPNPAEPDGSWNPASLAVESDGSIIFTDPWRTKRCWDRLSLLWKGNPTHHHLWRWSPAWELEKQTP